ncbi:MAG: hypothetical protein Q9214_005267, partial [Letrouitia sp. 1 TL-2023]
ALQLAEMVFWFLAAAAVVAWAATSKSSEQSDGSESTKRGDQGQNDRKTLIDTQESSQEGSQREMRRRNINTVNQAVYAGLSLRSTSTDIRVIVLRRSSSASAPLELELKIVPLDSYYWALSYAWGDDCDVRSVSVNGKAFLATSSVCVALEHLRSPYYDQLIWIDAMCINQANEIEMSFQWKLVRDIYSTASTTIVWLGPSTKASDVVIEHFKKWDHKREDLQIALIADSKRNLQAWRNFGDIVLRPYFSRLWIVQEVVVSRNPLAMCGKRSLAFDMIPSILSVTLDQKIPMIPFASRRWISPTQENVAMLGRFRRERNRSWPLDLKYWLRAYAGKHQCKRAKDRVFALIGVSTDGQDSTFKASTIPNLQVTSQIVEKDQDLNFILAGRGPGRDLSLPSWVPDFRLNPEDSFRGSMSSIFHAGNGFAAHGNHSASEPAVTANMRYSWGAKGRHDIFYDTLRQIMVVPGVEVDTIAEVGDVYNLDPLKEMSEINTILSAPVRNHHQNVLAQSVQMAEKLGGEKMQKPYPGRFAEPYPQHSLAPLLATAWMESRV